MKLVTFQNNQLPAIGAVTEDQMIVPLTAVAPDMLSFIERGSDGLAAAHAVVAKLDETIPLEDAHLFAPIPTPRRNIMCLGKNYAEHAEESHRAWGDKVELPTVPS